MSPAAGYSGLQTIETLDLRVPEDAVLESRVLANLPGVMEARAEGTRVVLQVHRASVTRVQKWLRAAEMDPSLL